METTRSLDLVAWAALAIALRVAAACCIVAANKARRNDCEVASLRRAIGIAHDDSVICGAGVPKKEMKRGGKAKAASRQYAASGKK